MSIQRIDRGRTHWYNIDGQKADGVTTLIDQGVPKPALINWAATSVAEFAADHLDQINFMRPMGRQAIIDSLRNRPRNESGSAAVRGTRVHSFAEQLVHGIAVDVPPELAGYVQSCARFLDDYDIQPVHEELVVAHRELNYCGTLDLIANHAIWDYKTAKSGIFGETAIQETAYLRATSALIDKREVELDGNVEQHFEIRAAYAVHLTPDDYFIYPVTTTDEVFELFLHARGVAHGVRNNRLRELVGDPLLPIADGARWA